MQERPLSDYVYAIKIEKREVELMRSMIIRYEMKHTGC